MRAHFLMLSASTPPFLCDILKKDNAEGKEFWSNICQYNMALAFTSLGVMENKEVNRRGGWVFHIQGELSHLIGSLHPNEGNPPLYA